MPLQSHAELYTYYPHGEDSDPVATRNRKLWTPGIRWYRKPQVGRFDFELETALQTGRSRLSINLRQRRTAMSLWKMPLTLLAALACINITLAGERLRLATTSSTDNSGLLATIDPVFTQRTGIAVDVIAVGTGKALKLGQNCDVDVVLVHAPAAEKAFVEAGYGINRLAVMHNDFVIVGPKDDPAGIRQAKTAAEALGKIARAEASFVSRGDDSGTHKKERQLWREAGIKPEGGWYYAIGQGMGAALQFAEEKQAYVLTDRGTWLAMHAKLPDLTITFEGDPQLFNPYHIIAVNPKRCPNVNFDAAMRYAAFLTGPVGQKLIADFKVGGRQLFHPDVPDY